jgi:hypothetical protein
MLNIFEIFKQILLYNKRMGLPQLSFGALQNSNQAFAQ